jgi:hypothetical protein
MRKIIIRIRPYLVISFCVLVLLICATGVTGFWFFERSASSAAVQILVAIDRSAQIMRNGLGGVDTGLATLGGSVSSVESASAQLSQNVNDRGLLLTLLPTTKEQELTTAAQSVRDNFVAIWDFLEATKEMVQAINGLPLVKLPGNSLATIETIQERMGRMVVQVEELNAEIRQFRSQAAASISRITELTTSLNSLLAGMRADLAQVDTELNTIQVQSRELQELLPIILLSSAIAVTLVAIWIGYSQIVMITRALSHIRERGANQAVLEPGEIVEESTSQEIDTISGEEVEGNGSSRAEADAGAPGNTEQSISDQFSNE